MPSHDIKSVLETKPLSFTLKTTGGKWKCTLHSNRQALEKSRSVPDRIPGISRADSDMSISSATSTTSSHQ
ncbi:uncharacterized protein PG998_004110 [Apiospora kogelbergensis]|uniref:Uncharacterized protein n=1 Tax=Apiospora kogelbergensis TaxID=1337665 RepID=A0AAW0QLH9_9PEZI